MFPLNFPFYGVNQLPKQDLPHIWLSQENHSRPKGKFSLKSANQKALIKMFSDYSRGGFLKKLDGGHYPAFKKQKMP